MTLTPATTPLSAAEARVLATLMEKARTVPDSYPLTLNTLLLGCNQKSSREPLMELSEADLHQHLGNITTVTGVLRVHRCEQLTSLGFLSQLTNVGSVELVDNPSLVDARISSLMAIEGSVAVSGCPKLCKAYITSNVHDQTMSTDGCRAVDLTLFLLIAGDGDSLGTIDWSAASTALTAALQGAASSINGAVC